MGSLKDLTTLSKLVNYIEEDTKNTEKALKSLKYNPASRPFEMKFPVIEKFYRNPSLQKRIANTCRAIGDEQYKKSNVKADMTSWFMHETDKDFEIIANKAIEIAHDNSPSAVALATYDCWGAVYKKGDWSKNHDHWPQIWSWVYNVECCDDCAPLVFHDSRDDVNSDHAYSLKPKSGRFTMFPGWIKHSVPKHDCDHDRIIVAGNISADPYHIIGFAQARDRERKITK